MQVSQAAKTHKPSPKNNAVGNANSYIAKQNPFKGATAAASGSMQTHAQYVNQPHHLVMPGQHYATGDEALNLQNLYPQSQSPMSFKQMQNVKR